MLDPVGASAWRRSARLLALLLVTACAARARAETIRNSQPAFTLEVPDGFEQVPPPAGMIYLFRTPESTDDGLPHALVNVERLGGMKSPKKIGVPRNAPPGSRIVIARWQSFDLEVLAASMTQDGRTLVGRTVQVPLDGEAIQINVAVPAEREASADAILAAFLSRLNGSTNWPVPMAPTDRNSFLAVGAGGIAAVLGVHAVVWVMSRRKRRRAAAAATHLPPRPPVRETPQARTNRAMKYGIVVAVTLCPLVFFEGLFYIGLRGVSMTDPSERGEQLMVGSAKFGAFVGFLTYLAATFFLNRRAAKLPPPPPAPPPPASAMPDFDNIVDDRGG